MRTKTSDISNVIEAIIHGEPVPPGVVEKAQKALNAMRMEALERGLTDADVIRAIFKPTLDERDRCNCPTCRLHREMHSNIWQGMLENSSHQA